jgi:parvulin-like peptidyl-prolyl isomerase
MSDEQPKNVQSVPPPTDEIDQDWGATPAPPGTATKSSPTAAKPATASSSKPSRTEDDEDEDEDEDDDETDEDEADSDDDDDEGDDDDDEEEAHASSAKPGGHGTAKPAAPSSSSDDWIPDGAPWVVLGLLVVGGIAGGLGFLGTADPRRVATEESAAHGSPSPSPSPAPKPTVAAAVPKPAGGDEESVEASHLLVQYQGSMRAAQAVTRTKEEAKKRAEEALAKAKKGVAFDKLVAEYSDEPNAAARGGKLGAFTRQRMVKPFADAAFALKPGQLSGIVETQFGYHVILRTK